MGAPTNHSRLISTTTSVMVPPRSGWSMSSANMISATGTSGTSRCRYWCSMARLVTSTCAPHRASATLATSMGWKDTPGRTVNQDRAPPASVPNGVSTSTSRTRQTSRAGADSARMRRSGTRSPT